MTVTQAGALSFLSAEEASALEDSAMTQPSTLPDWLPREVGPEAGLGLASVLPSREDY